jgi:hypothetical protein
LALAGVCSAAFAQHMFYVRGEFNSWGLDNPMTHVSGDHYQALVTGLTPGGKYWFKAANADWSIEAPAAPAGQGPFNVRGVADASGNLLVNFFNNPAPGDGWLPNQRRIGYLGENHGWELAGDFNGWNPQAMTSLGGGLYQLDLNLAQGSYDFKFRRTGDWEINIGQFFATDGPNANVDVTWNLPTRFLLDMPGGRYQAQAVPEPASMLALGLGVAAFARRRRKK